VTHECLHFDEELGDFWHYDVTVDVELAIPARLALVVRTMKGDVAVFGREGNVDVATNDGEIRLSKIRGNVSARAVGSVDLTLFPASGRPSSAIRVTAYAGDVTLRIPSGEAVRLSDRNAAVTSPLGPTELLRAGGSATRNVSVSVGPFGPSVDVGITRGRLVVMPSLPSQR
jgi:hypothetical protein